MLQYCYVSLTGITDTINCTGPHQATQERTGPIPVCSRLDSCF